MYVCMYHFVLYILCTVLIYTSQPKCYEVVLYSDDVQLLYQIDFFKVHVCMYVYMYVCIPPSDFIFYMTGVPINQTSLLIGTSLCLLNTDDLTNAIKTFKFM